ncbi:MAG: leucine-rich repeat domain-containing protein [Salinivirgaceae bacterium]|nr:leucine-rich repeat domain-containing protein [Salinivirgaceae bacterium]
MKSILRKMVAVFCLMVAMVATVDAQSSFAYQAVIRTANGEVVSEKKVSMRFSLKYNNEVVYSETHQPTTSKYGNVEVKVGEGQKVSGDFAKVPWHTMQVMMQIEADPNGGTNYIDLGAIQLQPAPYAMHAASTGLVVDSSSPKSGSGALFEVKDKDGNPVFAVYPDGVRVYVDDADGKAIATGFAVAGRRAAKDGEEANLFSVTSEGTQVTVDDAEGKAMQTGFAVAGRRAAKDADAELFTVNSTGTQVYIDTDADGKAMATGFAVAGRRAAKDGETDKYLEINESGTQIYIDDDAEGKPIATGFAVAGRRAAKGDNKYMEVTADGTTVFVDNADGKAMATGFAVAGRRAAKGKNLKLFEVNEYGTHIYIEEDAADKAMATGFAVAGRRAAKDGSPEKYMVIDADGAIIYVDYDDAKAMQTGFAVAGRRAAKDGAPSSILTVNNQDGTHVYIDDAEGKAMQTGFAVAGRRAAKDGQYIMQITDKSALMVTQNLMIDDKESNKSMMTMTTEGTVIKTENFVVAKEVENSDGTVEETSVFQATPEQGVQIAAESKVVVTGDVAKAKNLQTIEANEGAVLPGPISVFSEIVDTICSKYANILGQTNGYKLVKIHGKGLYTVNDNYDADGNAVIMFNKDGKVTYDNKSAALVVILTNPDSYKDAKMIFWPCCQINNLIVNFGLMDADGSNEYLPVQVVVNSVDGGVSRVELLSANEKMGTVELDGVPAYGTIVSAVAKPKPGYEFVAWGVGDGQQEEWINEETGERQVEWYFDEMRYSNPYNFAVDFEPIKLTALFQPIRVSYFADPREGGKIEVRQKCDDCETTINNVVVKLDYLTIPASSEGSLDYVPLSEENDSLTFVAKPEEGYKFDYWSIGWNDEEKITDSILTIKVEHSMEIMAHFVQDIDGPEKFGNSVGNDENKKFNEWYTEFHTVGSSESGVDDEGVYVKFKTVNVDGGGFPYNAQFNNILKGLPGQKVGNRFTLSFEAKWEPDKDVYGENAPGAAKLYLKTGKRINDGDGYQWEDDNTELLDEEGQIFREIYPKVINNEWNSYVWKAIIGEAGENFNDDYGMGAQIGIEMDLIDGGLNSGTFRFRNITVSIYDENSGQQYSATYFEKKVAQEQQGQPKRLIEIAEPKLEDDSLQVYNARGNKLEPYYSEDVKVNYLEYRLHTYYSETGGNFTFRTKSANLSLYSFNTYELNEYSQITSNNLKLTFEDYYDGLIGGEYNEQDKCYEFTQTIPLEARFVAMFDEPQNDGEKATIQIKANGNVSLYKADETESGEDELITTITNTTYTYECTVGDSIILFASPTTDQEFLGWFGTGGRVLAYDRDGNPSVQYSFRVREENSFAFEAKFQQEGQPVGDKATIRIMTNTQIALYLIEGEEETELNDWRRTDYYNDENEEYSYEYTYTCNIGDSIRFIASEREGLEFSGWWDETGQSNMPNPQDYVNNIDLYIEVAEEYVKEHCPGGYTGEFPNITGFYTEFTLKITKSSYAFMATFDEEEQQPTGAKIQVKTNGEVQFTVNGETVTPEPTTDEDDNDVYTFTCNFNDEVAFSASGDYFAGWWLDCEESDFFFETHERGDDSYWEDLDIYCVGGYVVNQDAQEIQEYNTEFTKTITADLLNADNVWALTAMFDGLPDTKVKYTVLDENTATCALTHVGVDYFNDERTSFDIPQAVDIKGKTYTVTAIGEYAFYDCSGLKSVTIPASVTKIGKDAFLDCRSMTSARFASVEALCTMTLENEHSNPMFPYDPAWDEDRYDVALYFGDEEKAFPSVEIPSDIDSVGQYAFINCRQLTSVNIPTNVKTIGNEAFAHCVNLSSVTIAEGSGKNGLETIKTKAFNQCAFPTIVLPNSLTTIGNNAFDDCDNLVSIVIPESVENMGTEVFSFIDNHVAVFCLTNGVNDEARFQSWVRWHENYQTGDGDTYIVSVVYQNNQDDDEPNIICDDNGLIYFIYKFDAREEDFNIDEDVLRNLTSANNFTAANGEAIVIGYRGDRADALNLTIPNELGDDSKALRSEVVAIARYAFYRENISSLTIGDDGSKAATPEFNLRFIGQGAFCNAGLRTLTLNGDESGTWYKYNYAEGGDAQKVTMNANELTTNSCENEFYRDDSKAHTFYVDPDFYLNEYNAYGEGTEESPFKYFAYAVQAIADNAQDDGTTDVYTVIFNSYNADSVCHVTANIESLLKSENENVRNVKIKLDMTNILFSGNRMEPIGGNLRAQSFYMATTEIGTPIGEVNEGNGLTNLVEVVLPDGIEEISSEAFKNCSNLVMTVPASVKTIGKGAFYGCNMQNITFENQEGWYVSTDNVNFSNDPVSASDFDFSGDNIYDRQINYEISMTADANLTENSGTVVFTFGEDYDGNLSDVGVYVYNYDKGVQNVDNNYSLAVEEDAHTITMYIIDMEPNSGYSVSLYAGCEGGVVDFTSSPKPQRLFGETFYVNN